jgi:hypothetical protein
MSGDEWDRLGDACVLAVVFLAVVALCVPGWM